MGQRGAIYVPGSPHARIFGPCDGLRVLALPGDDLPAYDAELTLEGKVVGRVTSAAPDPAHGVVALAYVRREVPADAVLELGGRRVSQVPD